MDKTTACHIFPAKCQEQAFPLFLFLPFHWFVVLWRSPVLCSVLDLFLFTLLFLGLIAKSYRAILVFQRSWFHIKKKKKMTYYGHFRHKTCITQLDKITSDKILNSIQHSTLMSKCLQLFLTQGLFLEQPLSHSQVRPKVP